MCVLYNRLLNKEIHLHCRKIQGSANVFILLDTLSTIISVDSSALYPQYSPTSTKLLCLRVGVEARLSCVRAQDLAFLLKIVP